jgi:hypothetical protein
MPQILVLQTNTVMRAKYVIPVPELASPIHAAMAYATQQSAKTVVLVHKIVVALRDRCARPMSASPHNNRIHVGMVCATQQPVKTVAPARKIAVVQQGRYARPMSVSAQRLLDARAMQSVSLGKSVRTVSVWRRQLGIVNRLPNANLDKSAKTTNVWLHRSPLVAKAMQSANLANSAKTTNVWLPQPTQKKRAPRVVLVMRTELAKKAYAAMSHRPISVFVYHQAPQPMH